MPVEAKLPALYQRGLDWKGKDILEQLDLAKARRVGTEAKRVNVDFPEWTVQSLDREARHLGVTRQSLSWLESLRFFMKNSDRMSRLGWATGEKRCSVRCRLSFGEENAFYLIAF